MDKSNLKYLRSCNPSKSVETIQKQLDAWMVDEKTCHYFAIQLAGQEVHPFGKLDRPFYELDKAIRKLEDLKTKQPEADFYIGYGALDSSALNFEDENAPMWERVWLNKHDWRLAKLEVEKMDKAQLIELIPNYDSVIGWQERNNTKEQCHYYFCESFDDGPTETPTSSSFTFNLTRALAARIHFTKIMPNRKFRISCGLLTTNGLLSMDGNESNMQELINNHKARLALLETESQDA